MLNKRLLNSCITLFSKYSAIDENDSVFQKDYSEVLIPTFVEHCLFTSKSNYKTSSGLNSSLGEVEVVLSLRQNTTRVYRIIENQKVYLTFVDEPTYKTLTLEQQYNKYFTLSNGLSFIHGRYEHSREIDMTSVKIKKLEEAGFDRHSISSVINPSKGIIKLIAKIG